MRSIQSKFLLLILISIFVSTFLVGSIGLITSRNIIDSNSVKLMNSISAEKAEEINNTLNRIKQTVNILSQYTVNNIESMEKLSFDAAYRGEYLNQLDELAITCALETEGTASVYIHFNPEITAPKTGIFRIKNYETGKYDEHWLTDITKYSPEDVEFAGWYYIPQKEKKPVWINPYNNLNTDVYMISYVVPVYIEDTFLGVVGMDVEFDYITNIVDNIKIYDSGYAFLTDSAFDIVHHRILPEGTSVNQFSSSLASVESAANGSVGQLFEYVYEGKVKKASFSMLDNGMCLAVTAPSEEIDDSKNELFSIIILITFCIMAVFFLITTSITRSIVGPLKSLTKAAKEIAHGNLDVNLSKKGNDEVGYLTESLAETAKQLKIRINYINKLAYTDKLTEVSNNTAYISKVMELNRELENSNILFSVAVVDVNGLKYINDNYGHDSGNYLIIAAADMLSSVFGRANVYRTGGDEFAVILKNTDIDECQALEAEFMKALSEQSGEIILSAAIGTASYDMKVDDNFEAVYKRADLVMYTRKSMMKSNGETSIINSK